VRPHRFRDSFAVNKLNKDVPIEAVSKMLGHKSVATTEKYYAPWVKSRSEHLRRAYLRSQEPTLTPVNVVPISRAG
jgi:integrase